MNTDVTSLQTILDQLYNNMLPLCTPLIVLARALAGFLSLWYIGIRVWGHIARAEPVDVFPLLRPFALGMAILLYPSLLALINGVLQPTVTATAGMLQNANQAIAVLIQNKQQPPEAADSSGVIGRLGADVQYQVAEVTLDYKAILEQGVTSVLEWIFEGAALVISIIRTFILTVMSILGPLVLGISVLDGFRHSFQHWLARYINVYLWLPVANIYGTIIAQVQTLMLQQDQSGDFVHGRGAAYIIFLLMGIIGYACVPATANYIVQALGGHALLSRANALAGKITNTL
jgi:Homologues of TraJ from Bacteroides conjugative transposon